MRYGGDKLKVVDTNLKLGDNLQALGFDACGYVLIGKWDDSYGTKGDPLTTTVAICPATSDCPNCQPKIKTVTELNGRPEPCGSGDAFIMMDKNGKLKSLCKDSFSCPDRNVAADQGDEDPGTLIEKLTVCDSSSPITIRSKTDGGTHKVCVGWDKSKAGLKFIDLLDTPNGYESPGLVVSNGNSIDYVKPKQCADSDYSYVVYNKKSNAFTTICDRELSVAEWILTSEYLITAALRDGTQDFTIRNEYLKSKFSSTDDIQLGAGDALFKITRPGVYAISANSTLHNKTGGWLKAVRGGITLNGNTLGDTKYDCRPYSDFINDFYPTEGIHPGDKGDEVAKELELSIMSFNNTYYPVIIGASVNNPVTIGFHVKPDTRVSSDPRHIDEEEPDNIELVLTNGTAGTGSNTVIQCVRLGDVPKSYKQRS